VLAPGKSMESSNVYAADSDLTQSTAVLWVRASKIKKYGAAACMFYKKCALLPGGGVFDVLLPMPII
jgi:hypothetical protein